MSFAPSFFEHLEDRLNLAVYDTNAEYRMSIHDLRQGLKHIPGSQDLVMQYGNGGATEIYIMGDVHVELPAGSSNAAIESALLAVTGPGALARVDAAVAALDTKKKLNNRVNS